MATAVAHAKNLSIAPRKVRLVADLIRGKKVPEARAILEYTLKRSALPLRKLLDSAVANAENAAAEKHDRLDTDEMVVALITVDQGLTLKRWRAMPRGRGVRIRKRRSHVSIRISGGERAPKASAKAKTKE
ncbi:MAG TPA: 50S ribosomal protein L22 [Candidatus Hydrogenedentes bacterium]|nr:50S ribosomal protein L22 [Candidatus Hydrogenedentota bacterium]HNT88714.1 50S ribosomal protein L22 [Candidatus Hydrogenedentota bacterium]